MSNYFADDYEEYLYWQQLMADYIREAELDSLRDEEEDWNNFFEDWED